MKKTLAVLFALFLSGPALADVPATAQEAEASDTQAQATATDAEAEEQKDGPIDPPPGFQLTKRGKHLLYCKKDVEVGTRFKRVTCYTEAQMKDYLLAREHNNRDFDQRRAICSNPAICSPQ